MTGGIIPEETVTNLRDAFDNLLDLVAVFPEQDIHSDWWTQFLSLPIEERNRLLDQAAGIVLRELAKWLHETNNKK